MRELYHIQGGGEGEATESVGTEEGMPEKDGSQQTPNKDAEATCTAVSSTQGMEAGSMDEGTLSHHEEGEGDEIGRVSTEEGKPEVDNQANETENGADTTNSAESTRERISGNEEDRGECEKD